MSLTTQAWARPCRPGLLGNYSRHGGQPGEGRGQADAGSGSWRIEVWKGRELRGSEWDFGS